MGKIKYPIIFVHIPRSGGMTLNSILQNNFPASRQFTFYVRENQGNVEERLNKFENLSPERKKKFLLLTGHINFGIHHYYSEHFTYLTFFRNPITRISSYYNYILKNKLHYLHNIIVKNRLKIKDILDNKISIEFDNAQVRQISGIKGIKFGECNDFMLEKAIENLDSYFPVFGITERFNESLVLIKNYFNLPSPFYVPLNQSNDKNLIKTPQETVELIKKTNHLDLKFYEYTINKFHKLIAQCGDKFGDEVQFFTRKNKRIKKFSIGKYNYGIKTWQLYTKVNSYLEIKK